MVWTQPLRLRTVKDERTKSQDPTGAVKIASRRDYFYYFFCGRQGLRPILAGRQGQCPNFAMSKCFKNRNVVNRTEYRYDVFSQISSPLTTGSRQPPAMPTPLSMTSTARHTAAVLGGRHRHQEEAKSKSAWLIYNTTPPRLFNPPSLPPHLELQEPTVKNNKLPDVSESSR